MSIIYGTINNETLTGTNDADVIYPKGGVDIVRAGDGNDEIVLDAALGFGSTINGGNGFDTLVLRTQAGVPYYNGGTFTQYNANFPTNIVSLEAARFESSLGDFLGLVVLDVQRASAGLTTLIGGAGRDVLYDVVFIPGEYTMPALTFQNWNSNIRDTNSDFVVLYAGGARPGNYILNAREGLATIQGLQGNAGNDVLNGSSGSDALNGGTGVDQLFGNGGDDILIVENLTPFGGVATTLTYAGSTYNGGSGEDVLIVGGRVDFQGTLTEIENIYFEPSYAAQGPGMTGLDQAHLILSGTNALTLASNAKIEGNGRLEINLGAITSFDASAYRIGAGFTISVVINGTSGNDSISGSMTNDTINGGDGNDTVFGNGGADSIYGGLGNDTLIGGVNNGAGAQPGDLADYLDGGEGNDTLRGGDGDDTLLGGLGDDDLRGDAGNDIIDGGDGTDFVSYNFSDLSNGVSFSLAALTSGTQTVDDGRGGIDTVSSIETVGIAGSEGKDELHGSLALRNTITGRGGSDLIFGGDLGDYLDGGAGLDALFGGDGDDTLIGGIGGDYLVGDAGNDVLDGGADDDFLLGSEGDDTLIGGTGSDTLLGDAGNDTIDGGEGRDGIIYRYDDLAAPVNIDLSYLTSGIHAVNDGRGGIDTVSNIEYLTLLGSEESDTLRGSTTLGNTLDARGGDDVIVGGNLDDYLVGGSGNDTIRGNAGSDLLFGGLGGFDTVVYSYDDLAVPVIVDLRFLTNGQHSVNDGRGGTDTVDSFERLSLFGTNSGDTLWGSTALNNLLSGNGGNDTINGGNVADQLDGGDGNDTINGNGGADTIYGGAGIDTIDGGDGDDTLIGGGGADILRGGNGVDTADYSASLAEVQVNLANGKGKGGDAEGDALSAIENVTGSGFADILTGSNQANRLVGGAGADTLNGGGGADELWGGTGADQFQFKSVADIGTAAAHDRIMDFDAGGAGSAVDRIDLTAIDANTKTANKDDVFNFIGDAAFSGKPGELRVVETSVGHASVFGDVNGDGIADFQLDLSYTGTLDPIDFLF